MWPVGINCLSYMTTEQKIVLYDPFQMLLDEFQKSPLNSTFSTLFARFGCSWLQLQWYSIGQYFISVVVNNAVTHSS